MTINLKAIIEEDSAVKSEGFSGAVFLTYSLNLGFYEQIIAPALERAGCSNVLIIADPDGYAEALEIGKKNVAYAGMRYVCTPLPRKGFGVQHAKMLFMAGANRGRLLIGSGNLTMHGFSRNLEVFSHYEYDHNDPDVESYIAIHSAWKLIHDIFLETPWSPAVQRQLDAISNKALWLLSEPPRTKDFQVWHNFSGSIWSQLSNWRATQGFRSKPVKEVRIFSPYYDQDATTLSKFVAALQAEKVGIYLSREYTTINSQSVLANWPLNVPRPQVYDIRQLTENNGQRLLHAKVIVGIEDTGSWCVAGSANMTRAGFDNSWRNGSNLELVTFRWSPNSLAFDYLLEDQVSISPIELDTLKPTNDVNHSEEPRRISEDDIILTELTFDDKLLFGRLNRWPGEHDRTAKLILIRSNQQLSISIDNDYSFNTAYHNELQTSECAYIKGETCESLPRWIDVPAFLQAYGSRSYHERVQAKLDTVAGTESLFRELMDFLFNRVIPDQAPGNNFRRPFHQKRKNQVADNGSGTDKPAPDTDHFVVLEQDPSGKYRIEGYTRTPYNHSIKSLRDLLSIVLLRLTTTPEPSTEDNKDNDDIGGDGKQTDTQEEMERTQIDARLRLCNYVIDYCQKYARRICQDDFINQISPDILLDNHITVSRVLLEFHSNVVEFSDDDFIQTFWRLWAPISMPSLVGINGKSTWQLFIEKGEEDIFTNAWTRLEVSSYFIFMTTSAFGYPPSWPHGIHNPQLVSQYLALKELILKIDDFNKSDFDWEMLDSIGLSHIDWEESIEKHRRLKAYLPPARERLDPIIDWINNKIDHVRSGEILQRISSQNLESEFEAYRYRPRKIFSISTDLDNDGFVYCPLCGGALRPGSIAEINRGKLVLCGINSDAWMYKMDIPAERVL